MSQSVTKEAPKSKPDDPRTALGKAAKRGLHDAPTPTASRARRQDAAFKLNYLSYEAKPGPVVESVRRLMTKLGTELREPEEEGPAKRSVYA